MEGKDTTDKKLIITGVIIIVTIISIIFSLSYLSRLKEEEVIYHYDIPILDGNGKEVGGVHTGGEGIPIENISITLVNITSSVSSYHELSEGVFVCKNTSLKLTYEDKNKDDLFNQGDFMHVSGQTPGSVVKIIHITGRSIGEIIFQ